MIEPSAYVEDSRSPTTGVVLVKMVNLYCQGSFGRPEVIISVPLSMYKVQSPRCSDILHHPGIETTKTRREFSRLPGI